MQSRRYVRNSLNYRAMEQNRQEIAQDALEDCINNCGFNPKRFAESTTTWDRYIQNELFKLALWIIRVYGSEQYRYDLRNEYAATKAREIVASGVLD